MTTAEAPAPRPPERHRALFLSDLHLGTLGCRADLILAFLERHTAETIYLVGDILDIWHPLALLWTGRHDRVLALLRRRAREGTRLVYLVGNHDTELRASAEAARLPAEIAEEAEHEGPDGRRYLVLHGDVCDARALRGPWLTCLGSRADSILRAAEGGLRSLLHRELPPEGRTLLDTALRWVNGQLYRNRSHERRLTALAAGRGFDGVICGHFHIAGLNRDHGVLYANCGDWVDSFTALAEGWDGAMRLLDAQPVRAAVARNLGPLARPAEA